MTDTSASVHTRVRLDQYRERQRPGLLPPPTSRNFGVEPGGAAHPPDPAGFATADERLEAQYNPVAYAPGTDPPMGVGLIDGHVSERTYAGKVGSVPGATATGFPSPPKCVPWKFSAEVRVTRCQSAPGRPVSRSKAAIFHPASGRRSSSPFKLVPPRKTTSTDTLSVTIDFPSRA